MGQFNITFDRQIAPPLYYEDYTVSVQMKCGGDGVQRKIRFNDAITGDFVVGYNFSNPAGLPAQTLKVLSYEDVMNDIEISTSVSTPSAGFTPSQLKNLTTNIVLTLPADIAISDLTQLGLEINSVELMCPPNSNYTTQRNRKLVYQIEDSAGTIGPIKQSVFTNNPE